MKKISYFSYKGGAGRSSVAYNTIPFLAKQLNASPKNPLVIVDLDVDSIGLSMLIKKNLEETQAVATEDNFSIQTILKNENNAVPFFAMPSVVGIEKHGLFKNLIKAGRIFGLDDENDASILFICAEQDKSIGEISNYDADKAKKTRFRKLIDICESYGCVGIVFDTPAGNQLLTDWAVEMSDTVIVCMRITYQFRQGTFNYLKNAADASRRFILVPNVVPTEQIVINGFEVKYDDIKKDIVGKFNSINKDGKYVDLQMVGLDKDFFGVNEIKRFKIKEDVLFKLPERFMSDDDRKAVNAYKKIVEIIAEEK